MHVWSKVFGPVPARSQETKRSAFEAMCNNSNCLHMCGSTDIELYYVSRDRYATIAG
jgi:hypothetical protein